MAARQDIEALRDQIVRQFHPRKVILFGSHAKGAVEVDSDVDLLVIMEFEGSPIHKEIEISLGLHCRFPLDLLVRTPQDVAQRAAMNDFLSGISSQPGRCCMTPIATEWLQKAEEDFAVAQWISTGPTAVPMAAYIAMTLGACPLSVTASAYGAAVAALIRSFSPQPLVVES